MIFESVGKIDIGRIVNVIFRAVFKNWTYFGLFTWLWKLPLVKLLLVINEILGLRISGAIFRILGPIQSNPVAFLTSKLFKKFSTK